jgi:hypothetical protein
MDVKTNSCKMRLFDDEILSGDHIEDIFKAQTLRNEIPESGLKCFNKKCKCF